SSRSLRAGLVLARLWAFLPRPVRSSGIAVGRTLARSRMARAWLGTASEDMELDALHHRLFSLIYPERDETPRDQAFAADAGDATPAVSVVAPLYNSARTIGAFLSAFNRQTYQ